MRRSSLLVLAILLASCLSARSARAGEYVPGEVVVLLKPGTDVDLFALLYGAQILGRSPYSLALRLSVGLDRDVEALVAALRLDANVRAADPNLIARGLQVNDGGAAEPDPGPGEQWNSGFNGGDGPLAYDCQGTIALVRFQTAGQVSNGSGVLVGILDTGISLRHPVLAARAVAGWNTLGDNANTDDCPAGLDANGNGRVDEAAGHGSMVAGLVARFAPGAGLLPVKVLNSDGSGTLWAAAEGVRYAVARGARVLNLSFGFTRQSGFLNESVNDADGAGVVLVTSAGNGNSPSPQFPGGNPQTLTVAALNTDNTKASFSNYGAAVDVVAPGVRIISTYWDGRYAVWSGTSFSAPIVAAEAALIRSKAPNFTSEQVRQRIITTSHSVFAWNPDYYNRLGKEPYGLVDFDEALSGL